MDIANKFGSTPVGINQKLMKDNGVIFCNFKRFYLVDMSQRGYDYEGSTPQVLSFDDFFSDEHSWVRLIELLARYIVSRIGGDTKRMIEFRVDWSSASIFKEHPATNPREVIPGLFVNCNHTAVHSIWLIKDLLLWFRGSIDDATLLIHRPPASEPTDLQEVYSSAYKTGFKRFLIQKEGKTDIAAEKVISNIEKMNKYLPEISKVYTNWFLICDLQTFSNLKSHFTPHMRSHYFTMPEKNFELFERYITYMGSYLKRCINSNSY